MVPDGSSVETALVSIQGGLATWSLASVIPPAVVAQQWPGPRTLPHRTDMESLDRASGVLRLHFNYHAQLDPEVVLEVLRSLQLRAT